MADQAAFRQVLQRCGFTGDAATCIVDEGYDALETIAELSDSDVVDMMKNLVRRYGRDDALNNPVNFPQRAINKFRAIRYLIEREQMLDIQVEPGELTQARIKEVFQEWDTQKHLLKSEESTEPAVVPELKTLKEYQVWINLLNTHLIQVRGGTGVPLAYVARENDQVDAAAQAATYSTVDERLIELMPHAHVTYHADNNKLFDILKPLTRNGEGWNVIRRYDRTRDGRKALDALKVQCLGDAQQSFRRDQAYLSLQKARYNGEKRNYGFQTYVGVHRKAHDELQELGELLTEERKVSLFMTGIRTADMNGGKAVVRSRPDYKGDFEACQAYLNQFVNETEAQDAIQHQIGATGTRQKSTTHKKSQRKKHYGPGFIKKEEWLQMSKEERDNILKQRQTAETKAKNRQGQRSASATTTNPTSTQVTANTPTDSSQATVSAVQQEPATQTTPSNPTPTNNDPSNVENGMGNQFGRRAYQNSSVSFAPLPPPYTNRGSGRHD